MFKNDVILFSIIFVSLSSCKLNNIELSPVAQRASGRSSISKIEVVNNQLKITGTNLAGINSLKIKNNSSIENFTIISASSTQVMASATRAVSFHAGRIFELILGSAEGSAVYPVSFLPENGSITAPMLSSMGASAEQVLKYNGSAWVPSSIYASQLYMGTWNADTNSPDLGTVPLQAGNYYIVTTAGTFGGVTYNVGDWIMTDGTNWSRIAAGFSFNGRSGAVLPVAGDYAWSQITKTGSKLEDIADVDVSAKADGFILKWDASNAKWIMAAESGGAGGGGGGGGVGPGSITNTEISATANIAATKIGTGAVSTTEFNSLTGVTSSIQTQLNAKEPLITATAATDYYRGDKTFATLNTEAVPESGATNLYYSNARVLLAPLTGLDTTLVGGIAATDTVLQAFGKTQKQISAMEAGAGSYLVKNGNDNITGTVNVTTGFLTLTNAPSGLTDAANKQYVDTKLALSGGSVTGDVTFNTLLKLKDAATNYVTLKAPTTVTTSYVLTLPTTAGSANQILTTDGLGVLSWSNPASADVSGTTLSTYAVGANAPLSNSDTVVGAFGKLQGQLNELLSKTLTGLSTATNAVITSTDTIIGAFGKLQKQISDLAVSSVGGDLSGNLPNPTVVKIQGTSVSAAAPANGEFLKYNSVGTSWEPSAVTVGDLKSTALGSLFPGTGCNANQTLYYSVVGDAFSCLDIGSLDGSKITTGTIDAARLPSSPYVIGGTFVGAFANSQILIQHPFPINVTIPQNCTNSRFEVAIAATASTTITMKKCTAAGFTSCTTFGTAVIAGGAKVASFTCASATSFVGGTDSLLITAPASADATAATAGWALYGTR